MTTQLELLTAWRSVENLILIGDDFQLSPPVLTMPTENPFCRIMGYSPFARFRDLHMPAFLLNEQMRMPADLMHLANDIIYSWKSKDGTGTALTDNLEAQAFKSYRHKMYPSLKHEPEELLYPIMFNIHGESTVEKKGTSVYNAFNVATTIEEIMKLFRSLPNATSAKVAIATPYRAQIRKYRRTLVKADEPFFCCGLLYIYVRIGTASCWQGKELGYMFVYLVRASNDTASTLGFVKDARLLNVLITRQKLGLVIIGDERCVLTLAQQAERDDPIPVDDSIPVLVKEEAPPTTDAQKVKKSPEDKRNATLIAIFDWVREKGRVVNVTKESLTEDFVDFPKPYVEPEVGGWGDDAADNDVANDDAIKDNEPSTDDANSPNGTAAAVADQYEDESALDMDGEDIVGGHQTAGSQQDSSGDSEDGIADDDEMPSATGLGQDGWESAATTVSTQGHWALVDEYRLGDRAEGGSSWFGHRIDCIWLKGEESLLKLSFYCTSSVMAMREDKFATA